MPSRMGRRRLALAVDVPGGGGHPLVLLLPKTDWVADVTWRRADVQPVPGCTGYGPLRIPGLRERPFARATLLPFSWGRFRERETCLDGVGWSMMLVWTSQDRGRFSPEWGLDGLLSRLVPAEVVAFYLGAVTTDRRVPTISDHRRHGLGASWSTPHLPDSSPGCAVVLLPANSSRRCPRSSEAAPVLGAINRRHVRVRGVCVRNPWHLLGL